MGKVCVASYWARLCIYAIKLGQGASLCRNGMGLIYGAWLNNSKTNADLHDAHVEAEDQDIVYSQVDYISHGCCVHLRENDPLTTQKKH